MGEVKIMCISRNYRSSRLNVQRRVERKEREEHKRNIMEIKITRVERNRTGAQRLCSTVNYYFWHGGRMKTNSVVGNRDRRVAAVEYRAWRVRVKTKIYEFIFTRSGAEITIEW